MNWYIVKRWSQVVCISAWGPLCLFVTSLASDRLVSWSGYLAKVPAWFSFGSVTIGLAIVFVPLVRSFPFSRQQFRFFLRYPPRWFAWVLGAAWILALISRFGIGTPTVAIGWRWGLLAAFIASAMAFVHIKWISSELCDPSNPSAVEIKISEAQVGDIAGDWRKLEQWVMRDDPIVRPEQDLFEMRHVARRMARQLRENARGEGGVSMGLIGPFGSGKSSIVNLIRQEMERLRDSREPHVWICETSCWGFDDSAAALHHVLSAIVKTIGGFVDCSVLRKMPDAYGEALAAGSEASHLLWRLIGGERDPAKQLGRLTPILIAANARLLIVLEDLDRNQSPSFNPDDIISMLFRLKSVKGVSFILAASSESRVHLDFAKLCEHIEMVPSLRREDILTSSIEVREHCLGSYSFIDPERADRRKNLGMELWSETLLDWPSDEPPLPVAICSLCDTPRKLKHSLRHALLLWQDLHGEVDLDELMAVSVLRHGAPEAFEFVLRNMDVLRQEGKREGLTNRQKALSDEWDQWTQKVEWDRRSALDLVLFLVPGAAAFLKGRRPWGSDSHVQGVMHSSPTDYWRRIIRGGLSEDEMSDQILLEQIEQWRQTDAHSPALAQFLHNHSEQIRVWEHLDEATETPQLLELADQLIEILLMKERAQASAKNDALIGIWRRSNRRLQRSAANAEWLAKNLRKAMPVSLQMVVSLYDYCASPKYGIVEQEGRNSCRTAAAESFESLLGQHGADALINILDNAYPFTLGQFVFPQDRDGGWPSVLQQHSDWKWIAPVLISAARIAPEKVMPQIACLISKSTYTDGGAGSIFIYGLDLNKATGLFEEDLRQLMELLAREVATEDKSCAEIVASVRSDSRAWLDSNPGVSAER